LFTKFLSSKEKEEIKAEIDNFEDYDFTNTVADWFIRKRACDSREDLIAQQLSAVPSVDKNKKPRLYIAYSKTTNQSFMKVGVSATEKSKHHFRLKSVHSGDFTLYEYVYYYC
jgi:hypothetical protein